MVAKSSLDWLPPGWSVQSRDQKRGRKIEFYTHLETGKKFFSKDDAMRYIKKENTRGEKRQPASVHIPNHSEEVPSQLEVDPTDYPEWLPNGWKVELRTRQNGVQVGREYKCYIDPSRECTFYSKPEVFRYLKTVKRMSLKSGNLKSISSKRCRTERKAVTTMQLAKNVYVEKHHVEDLPPGWIKEIKVTKYANRFRRDPYYTDPDSGYVFRSKKDVICYLETGKISKHAFKPKNMCRHDLKLAKDAPSSATKRQKLEHPFTRRQLSQPKIELSDRREGNMSFVEVEGFVIDPGKMSSAGDEPGSTPSAHTLNENNLREAVMEKSNERRAPVHSSKSKNQEIHNLSCWSSKRLAGIRLELPETESSKLLDKRVPYESEVAFSSTAEIVQDKHLTGNMLEKCAETKEDSSQNTLEKSNVRRALLDSSKSTNKEKLNFSHRFSKRLAGCRLELPESESSKLQDNMVTSVSAVSFASTAEVVQEKFLVNILEKCAKTKEDGSPSRPLQPKAELSDIHEGAKSDVRRAPVDSSKSRNKEKLNLCRRFSKRLAGSRLELPETESSELPDKMVFSVSGVAFASTADVVQEKQLTDNMLEKCAKTEEDGFPSRSSQPKAELSERHEGERSLLEVEGPVIDPGKMMCAGNEPIFNHAAYSLNENNSLKTLLKKSNVRRSLTGLSKSKNNEKLNSSCRSSKRLAGLEPEGVANLVSSERAVQAATRKPSKSDTGQYVGLASDLVNKASQQLGPPSETKVTHHTCTDIKSPFNKGETPLDDQVVPKEQQQELETEKIDAEKPEPELSFLFGSDPCLEFAFKTLTGELPIFDTVDNRPIPRPASDMVKKENLFDSGMEKNCSRNPRANKSKDNKELKLPRQSPTQYAGVEPELLANTMSKERAIRNATENSCKSIAIPAVDLADEASQPLEITPEAKLAICPCTAINTSMQEEPSNKSVALEEHAVPQEKPQKFETKKAHVENLGPQFSFPFTDSWSDPCLDFAFKTLTGAIPLEDYYHGYFQEKLDTSHNHRDSLALPDFGSPSLFQSDILPQFDPPEESVSGQQFPTNSAFLPSGNVSMLNPSVIGSGQQLSRNPSSLPAGNVSMSNCSGVCSGQQLSRNPSSFPARNVSTTNCSGGCSDQQLSMNSSFPPAGSISMSNCNGVCSGQQLSINSSFLSAGNVSL